MALSWSGRRQILYTSVGAVIVFILLMVIYEAFFTAAPSCFDNKQDGTETGVDCGGSCSLVCPDAAKDPVVLWARAFDTGGNYYTAAAYVENSNLGAGAKQVKYSFQLFDAANSLVIERDGVADIPPVQTVPVIEPNINAGNRVVTHALFAFTDDPSTIAWRTIPASQVPVLQVTQQNLSTDGSRLSATITNNTLTDAKNVTVAAVLFDANGVARAASKSLIDVPRQSSAPVVFTWPGGVANIVKAEITVLPSF
ncbi:MAG: hypothetical protein KGH79_03585 [Patescibacteria group bacterium]|nr:hypothetical protein [Patescibacteria group bacterium]